MTRRSGYAGGLVVVALVVAVVVGGHYLAIYIDHRRFPWGYRTSGSPPLVGTWVGPFTTRSGRHLALRLDIELAELGRGRRLARPLAAFELLGNVSRSWRPAPIPRSPARRAVILHDDGEHRRRQIV